MWDNCPFFFFEKQIHTHKGEGNDATIVMPK